MDNASKALIMAGAILISLALVGLGVYIFSISSDLQSNAGQQMDVMAAQTTNKQLSNYAGVKKRGSEVKSMISLVSTLNSQQVFPVNIKYGTPAATVTPFGTTTATNCNWVAKGTPKTTDGDAAPSGIRDSAWYEVQIYDMLAADGYLDTIYITAYATETP